jgi:hypothetical protein
MDTLAERVAAAILAYNKTVSVMSPNTVYMGHAEYYAAVRDNREVGQLQQFMDLTIVRVELSNYLQVARV